MTGRKNQKMFAFGDKLTIDNLLKEESKKNNCTESSIVESLIKREYFPKSEFATRYLLSLYSVEEYQAEKEFTVIMAKLYSNLASYNNMWTRSNKALLEFSLTNSILKGVDYTSKNKWFDGEYYAGYLLSNLESMVNRCSVLYKDDRNSNLQFVIEEVPRFISAYEKDIRELNNVFGELYTALNCVWDYIYKYSFTYKILMELAKLQKDWNYSDNTRYEFRQALIIASSEWGN